MFPTFHWQHFEKIQKIYHSYDCKSKVHFTAYEKKRLDQVTGKFFLKHLFLQQLTQNMTKDCSLKFESRVQDIKLQAQKMVCT